jgi:hypothetical protein
VFRPLSAAALLAFALVAAAAPIVERKIPADAARGKVDEATASMIRIDGKSYRLAPGTRFVTPKNLTVTPNFVAAGTRVRYTLDDRGQVNAVWLMDEPDRASGPVQRTAPGR